VYCLDFEWTRKHSNKIEWVSNLAAKDRLGSNELNSNVALYRACTPLARLMQIARLMNLDDLEDVLDLISSSKRQGNWDLKLEDSKAYLSLRVEFEADRVSQLLRVADEE
jgi:hypothetical protein